MPKINEFLLGLDVFQHATSICLNKEYYHIRITEDASNL